MPAKRYRSSPRTPSRHSRYWPSGQATARASARSAPGSWPWYGFLPPQVMCVRAELETARAKTRHRRNRADARTAARARCRDRCGRTQYRGERSCECTTTASATKSSGWPARSAAFPHSTSSAIGVSGKGHLAPDADRRMQEHTLSNAYKRSAPSVRGDWRLPGAASLMRRDDVDAATHRPEILPRDRGRIRSRLLPAEGTGHRRVHRNGAESRPASRRRRHRVLHEEARPTRHERAPRPDCE